MYEVYASLRDARNLTDYQVAKETGIPRSTFSEWKKGSYVPKAEKIQKLADFFGVTFDYLMTGKNEEKESVSGKKWYFDDATAEMAQDLFTNPGQRILFSASRGARPEDLQMAADLLQRLKGVHGDEQ